MHRVLNELEQTTTLLSSGYQTWHKPEFLSETITFPKEVDYCYYSKGVKKLIYELPELHNFIILHLLNFIQNFGILQALL